MAVTSQWGEGIITPKGGAIICTLCTVSHYCNLCFFFSPVNEYDFVVTVLLDLWTDSDSFHMNPPEVFKFPIL